MINIKIKADDHGGGCCAFDQHGRKVPAVLSAAATISTCCLIHRPMLPRQRLRTSIRSANSIMWSTPIRQTVLVPMVLVAARPMASRDTEGYWVPRIGVKAGFGDSVDCMADYSQPWGAHTKPGANWMGANDNIETKIESDNYAATCSYKWDMGKGQFRIIGGGFYQEVGGFKESPCNPVLAPGFDGVGRLDLDGHGWGWRAGAAYEIPEYAFRASLVYNSAVDLDNLGGTIDLTKVLLPNGAGGFVPGTKYDVSSFASACRTLLELKVQSDIAPGWLVFGSIKWTDWSQLQVIQITPNSTRST